MIEEIIGSIIEAERKAEEIIRQARSDAKTAVTEASAQAKEIAAQAERKLKEQKAQAMVNAEYVAERASQIAREDCLAREKQLRLLAEQRKESGIEFVIGKLSEN